MNRKNFIKGIVGAGVIGSMPGFIIGQNTVKPSRKYPTMEMVGKRKPDLFGEDVKLRKRALEAFNDMRSAGFKAGINVYSQSSYRSFDHQKQIWNRKVKGAINNGDTPIKAVTDLIRSSTIPGTSRHHWGTEVDFIDMAVQPQPLDRLEVKNYKPGGEYEHLQYWLLDNAESYGFYLTYTDDPTRKGFKYEPWHYSYAELAVPIFKEFININWKEQLQDISIAGSHLFTPEFMDKYFRENILGISKKLLKM